MRLLKRILLILPVLFLVLTCSKDDDPEMFILSVTITPEDGGSASPDGGTFDDGAVITPELLLTSRVLRKLGDGVKVLGDGELTKKLVVHAQHFSTSARAKIEAAGGRVEVLKA